MPPRPKAYLAGPAVFHPAAKAVLDYLSETCARFGLEGVKPFEPGEQDWERPDAELAAVIRAGNMERIRACDVVVACVSPFRGAGADPGTAWEMGYAEGLGRPVVAWTEDARPYVERVPHDRDADGRAFCKVHGMVVEDFGLPENLMYAAGPVPVQSELEDALRIAARLTGAELPPES